MFKRKSGFYLVAGFKIGVNSQAFQFDYEGDDYSNAKNEAWQKYQSLVDKGYKVTITLYKSDIGVLDETL